MTLVEVLIATSLLALLSILVISGLRLGFRFWERIDAARTAIDDVAFAQQFLRRTIETAYPRLKNAALADAVIDFSGDANRVTFVTPALRSRADAGFSEIILRATATSFGESLSVEYRQDAPDKTAETSRAAELIIADVKDVRFYYLANDGDWRPDWIDQPALPSLVRVEIDFAENDRRFWPMLVVAPAIDVDQSCRYDPLTKYCRGRRR